MNMIVFSILAMLGLGLVSSILLAVASRVFFVKENPLVESAMEILPGANCGGCGYAGCEGYAKAVVSDPDVPANRCCASSKEGIVALAELTGKVVAEAEPLVAMRRCDIYHGQVATTYEYQGIPSCAAATPLRGGSHACNYSCLGFGDCVQACPFFALSIVGGLACTDVDRCTGCGACVTACPRDVLKLIPKRARVCVPCNSRDKGKTVMEVCGVGCITCMKCVRSCPAKAVSMKDNLIVIDHDICLSYGEECGMACVRDCPRDIFRPIDLEGKFGLPVRVEENEKAVA